MHQAPLLHMYSPHEQSEQARGRLMLTHGCLQSPTLHQLIAQSHHNLRAPALQGGIQRLPTSVQS